MNRDNINDILLTIDKNIEKVLNDTTSSDSIERKSTVVDQVDTKNKKEYLNDTNFRIEAALDVSKISKKEAREIATNAFNVNRYSSGVIMEKSSGSDYSLSNDSDSDENSNILKKAAKGLKTASDFIASILGTTDKALENLGEEVTSIVSILDENGISDSTLGGVIVGIVRTIADGMRNYQDGVSETSFGYRMEETWQGSSTKAFLDFFKSRNEIVFMKSTPLDAGPNREALYGSMMLGAPFLFNEYSDPNNRALINTLIKDGKFVTFTPGLPMFNGTSYTASKENSILNQTSEPLAMLSYLKKNGLDEDFNNRDKRYYTFRTDYEDYFAYLETMLNTVWVKMGLAEENGQFNLFTFFQLNNENGVGYDSTKFNELIPKYRSSIGFFTNVASSVAESIDSSPTTFGDELADAARSNAAEYQRINYITGMGTGGAARNISRKIGIGLKSASQVKSLFGSTYENTLSAARSVSDSGGSGIAGVIKKAAAIAKVAVTAVTDTANFVNTQDLGAVIQSFATANGMMVKYPDLWSDSSYSKSINFNFTFTSPYGDPLSIFKYVYVPFFALMTFAMPRQAAENGFVSPFLVRCDVPGLISSDLALISSFTWTRGGGNSLWTKDGLPRAIDVTLTVQDLYPYLAMSKRISFLSANPSYAVFLDTMSGMMSLNDNTTEDALNKYFDVLLNRINNSSKNGQSVWNKFNTSKSALTHEMANQVRSSISATVDPYAIPWLHNSSLS